LVSIDKRRGCALESFLRFGSGAGGVRVSAVLGIILVLLGLLLLYLLRSLLVQVIFVLLGVFGLVVGVVFIIVGFGLIFGRRAIRRGFTWRVSALGGLPDI
jgi:hypothetical protein